MLGTTVLASRPDGTSALPRFEAQEPSLSADGRVVAFSTYSALVPGDTNNAPDVYVRTPSTGRTARVSLTAAGAQTGNAVSATPAVSGDGRLVAFASRAPLVRADTNGMSDTYLRDRGAP